MSAPQVQRLLIHIPIIHSQKDMGNLGRRLPNDEARRRRTQARWDQIWQQVQALGLAWPKVKVFQDGLPDAQSDIIRNILAEVQSPNYDLLRWLVAQGAELVGTESPALMKEEYGHLQAVLTARDAAVKARARRSYEERAAALLVERDTYIAGRIAATLPPGGVGLLFIGQAHRVAEQLPADIAVEELLDDGTTAPTDLRARPGR